MSVRLVATDLDGTLVHSDGSITPRSRAALAAAEEAGIDVVFVTGRPLRWADEVFEHVGGHGFAIVSNGALVWDVTAGEPALERAISIEVLAQVADRLRTAVPGSHFA
ncbi:MAG: HAD family hydrolase, partial [Marmoricola sp.]